MIELLIEHPPPRARDLVARVTDVLEANGVDLLAPEDLSLPGDGQAAGPGTRR